MPVGRTGKQAAVAHGPRELLTYTLRTTAQSWPALRDPMCWTHQAPLTMDVSGQEERSGLPFASPGDLPNPGLLHYKQICYCLSHREVVTDKHSNVR